MKYHLFGGHTGLRSSEVALGCARSGTSPDSPVDAAEARSVFRAFVDAGGTTFDTSSAYQGGGSETMLGSFVSEIRREDVILVSKYGRTTLPSPSAPSLGSHRKAMHTEIEGSLRRLRTDHLDIYFAHFDDGQTPIEEVMRGFDELVRAGKIRYAGLSNFPAWRCASGAMLAQLRGWAPLTALELAYNLLDREAEREHLPFADAAGLAVMAYSPLAGGRIGKTSADPTRTEITVSEVIRSVAAELGRAPNDPDEARAIALAWVLAKGRMPVLGPRTVAHLTTNLAALALTLSEDQIRRLDEACPPQLGDPYDLLRKVRLASALDAPRNGRIL